MNEAIPEPNIQQPNIDNVKAQNSLSNRILGYAFLASVLINIGWVTWVANSNIFGGSTALIPLKETKIKVFHPIPQPPKPKPPKVLPPPPPPKQQPQVKPPPPLQIPQPHPPVPTHQFKVATTNAPHTTTNFVVAPAPDTAPPATPVMPSDSGPDVKAPPPPVESQPGPAVVAPPVKAVEQPKPVVEQPKPVEVHHPDNWVPIDTQEASTPDGLGDNVSVDGIDSSSITNPKVVITFTIDENGRAKNVHVSESCGNNELDTRFADAVRRAHYTPAIQDHIPRDAQESLTFQVNQ